ncbi:type II secretion system F family protein [Joostella atrarenae]|uniref:Type II secretion system F family protein n=1 Tax=Joostella atrarenae TaxID=679257 RepID=A0ABS9J528_9FLAO|nr:type II secretion system F family protein [Joostella atrarenae]MCF8715540.1 type II secretion system F family protein [Joostella atrarenae]
MSIDLSTYQSKANQKKVNGNYQDFFAKQLVLGNGFSDKKKMEFYKELYTLLSSGVDFRMSLEILKNQEKTKKVKTVIDNIQKAVVKGQGLHEAMQYTGKFSPYEYYSIKIGEETRKLGDILLELSLYYERRVKMKRQIISVFTYPAFVLLLTFGVLYFMMKYVVPMFSSVFRQFGKDLPPITQKVVYLSNHFSAITWGIFIFFGLLFGLHTYFKNQESYKIWTSRWLLKIPFLGKLIKQIYITRFCNTLSLLLRAKTPLITSLELIQKMIAFYPIEASLEVVKRDIKHGMHFSSALAKHSIYDSKMISMINISEQVNKLEEMFERLSVQYNEETEHKTKMMGVVMEPLIIIIIGLIVGTVLIAMYSPMFDLSKIL